MRMIARILEMTMSAGDNKGPVKNQGHRRDKEGGAMMISGWFAPVGKGWR
jgi:hypothetical protein